ncbi:hypothetical protein D3C78_1266740 [compost metagenome]
MALAYQSPPFWHPAGTKKPTGVGLDDGWHLTNVPLCVTHPGRKNELKNDQNQNCKYTVGMGSTPIQSLGTLLGDSFTNGAFYVHKNSGVIDSIADSVLA